MVNTLVDFTASSIQVTTEIGRSYTVQLFSQQEPSTIRDRILVNGICLLNLPFGNQSRDSLIYGLCGNSQAKSFGQNSRVQFFFLFRLAFKKALDLIHGCIVQSLALGQRFANLKDVGHRQGYGSVIRHRLTQGALRHLVCQKRMQSVIQQFAEVFVAFIVGDDFLLCDCSAGSLQSQHRFDCITHRHHPFCYY